MGKLLRSQDILLLCLAGAVDLFIEFKNAPMAQACETLYGWVPPRYRRTNFYQTVHRSLKVGYIEKVEKNGEVYLRLTGRGEKKIKRDFPISIWQRGNWDKKWRIVIFDIAELQKGKRNNLRKKLKELGFGMLQKSVWITPYDFLNDFREFIQSEGLEGEVFVFETTLHLVGNPVEFASRIWPLEKINNSYKELLSLMINECDRTKISREKLRECRARYLGILKMDPCLPKDLLPKDWFGIRVKNLLGRLTRYE